MRCATSPPAPPPPPPSDGRHGLSCPSAAAAPPPPPPALLAAAGPPAPHGRRRPHPQRGGARAPGTSASCVSTSPSPRPPSRHSARRNCVAWETSRTQQRGCELPRAAAGVRGRAAAGPSVAGEVNRLGSADAATRRLLALPSARVSWEHNNCAHNCAAGARRVLARGVDTHLSMPPHEQTAGALCKVAFITLRALAQHHA